MSTGTRSGYTVAQLTDQQHTLVLADDRHHLDGDPVYCGTPLELQLPDGAWLRGRYEMRRDPATREPIAMFYTRVASATPWVEDGETWHPQVSFDLPDGAVVRRCEVAR